MSSQVSIVFPHQLFATHPVLNDNDHRVFIVEETLFFNQYRFHQTKLWYHRATMKTYEKYLKDQGRNVIYIEAKEDDADIRLLIKSLASQSVKEVTICDPVDDWLDSRIRKACEKYNVKLICIDSPMFINTPTRLKEYFANKKKMFQTDFYIDERKRHQLLLEEGGIPTGGRWTYDTENRKKYPKNKIPPKINLSEITVFGKEAQNYIEQNYPNNPGDLYTSYPTSYTAAEAWLEDFLETRFGEFGPYEDALVSEEHFLHHSVLTPMLNIGLLLPMEVIRKAIAYGTKHGVSIASIEGFVRQILGWREFIRAVYLLKGREERTKNFWNFTRPMPSSFYNGTTGIDPIDTTINKLLKTSYNHHIERLMVIGNMMLLQEIHPDAVYQWFMEMYIDAYDWVMVPNVYGMSQFADGGLMATKPYISGSNYLMKMSNYSKGDWQRKWDGLFWYFMENHRTFFSSNPRLGMLLGTLDKMDVGKKEALFDLAIAQLNEA